MAKQRHKLEVLERGSGVSALVETTDNKLTVRPTKKRKIDEVEPEPTPPTPVLRSTTDPFTAPRVVFDDDDDDDADEHDSIYKTDDEDDDDNEEEESSILLLVGGMIEYMGTFSKSKFPYSLEDLEDARGLCSNLINWKANFDKWRSDNTLIISRFIHLRFTKPLDVYYVIN